MKKFMISFLLLLLASPSIFACEVCEKNQPAVLKGITHGEGPQGQWDYLIIWIAVVIVAITLLLSIKYLVWPREKNPSHIKNIVLTSNKSYL